MASAAPPAAGSAEETAWADSVLASEGELTMEEAFAVLQLPPSAWGDADAAKAAYRRLSVRWHPDKHPADTARAHALFVRVAAAYNTLTTANFDYKRWAESFVVPTMQTLEDVLMLAIQGADPFVVDAMLRKRGDYRPHAQFGVDLAVPWSAGTQETPSWEVVGAAHTKTRALEGAAPAADAGALVLLRQLGAEADDVAADPKRRAGGCASRPWERVGGTGFEAAPAGGTEPYTPPALRPELSAEDAGAAGAADALNDAGLAAFSTGRHREAAELFGEAFRLRPGAAAYAANEAAAHAARGAHAAAAAAARAALALEPTHARAATRLGAACLALGEAAADAGRGDRGKALLREAKQAFALALKLQPGAPAALRGAKQAGLAWAAEFDSDEE